MDNGSRSQKYITETFEPAKTFINVFEDTIEKKGVDFNLLPPNSESNGDLFW